MSMFMFMPTLLPCMLSRALCYKPPQLTPEDLKWDGTADGEGDDAGATAYAAFDNMAEVQNGSCNVSWLSPGNPLLSMSA